MIHQDYWRHITGGIELFIRLTPKSSRDAIEGIECAADGRRHLKARVRAVPEDGKANKALIKLVSKALDVPASAITLAAGQTSRLKTLHVMVDISNIEARLDRAQDSEKAKR